MLNAGVGQLVLPEIMWAITRYLSGTQSCSREQLLERISPASLQMRDGSQSTLQWMVGLGLLVDDEKGALRFSGAFAEAPPKTETAFKRGLRLALLSDRANEGLLDVSVQERGVDLVRGLCWLLAQSPLDTVWTWETAQSRGAPDRGTGPTLRGVDGRMIVNDNRWNMFVHWAQYLGFAERWTVGRGLRSISGAGLISNPARAVADAIAVLWAPGTEVAATDFCGQILAFIPVLPGGRISPASGRVDEASAVSITLSYAMLVNSMGSLISFTDKSDAGSSVLLDFERRGTPSFRRISSVSIGKASNG
nr:protein DpdG [Aeromicrobium sp. A1-2]